MTTDDQAVSLIATVKDSGGGIETFLDSVAGQTRAADEVIVVDGGSADGTLDILRRAKGITLIEAPGANIARGRNIAIANASHDVIACSDADCVLEPLWLERLTRTIEEGADVAMGFYVPIADTFFQRCLACVNLPDADEIDPERFMPSGRSVAYRRTAIDAAGGYPEWLAIGEDMYVDHRWRELGLDMRFVPDAIAHWPLRPDLRSTWTQYVRYARGDAEAGMHGERHALRSGVYAGLAVTVATGRRWPLAIAGMAGLAYARRPLARAFRRLDGPVEKAAAVAVIPGIMATLDIAKMAGYARGLAGPRTRSHA